MPSCIFQPADILLPKQHFETWAVIACDQFTSQPDYWRQVEAAVGDAPSALRVTLPEIYLGQGDPAARIRAVNRTMRAYLDGGVFSCHPDAMMLVHRATSAGVRRGVVGVIDLAAYDYRKGSKSLIRATEETVLERIPPRVRIRRDAPLELPHVLLLMDDPADTVLTGAQNGRGALAYDFDLMQNGGHLSGWFLNEQGKQGVQAALQGLLAGQSDPLLFVVGDGNHSLATAKECAALRDHPAARYALVEIVNVHDPAIQFEPIYRVLFGVEPAAALTELSRMLGDGYAGADAHTFTCLHGQTEQTLTVPPAAKLPVGTLQPVLDAYLQAHPSVTVDYIHGTAALRELCRRPDALGFLFAGMKKEQLFDAVRQDGSLPRKTFSMGHAEDKRYYVEARRIGE